MNRCVVGAAAALAVAGMVSASSAGVPSSPAGLWISDQTFGSPARGALSIRVEGTRARARIAGRTVAFTLDGDSVRFDLPGSRGGFRGRLEPARGAIRGFWIRPAISSTAARAAGDRGGPFDQALATPLELSAVGAGIYRGEVAPLEARFTLYLRIWPDSAGWRAAFRNPQFNLIGGAKQFRMQVDGDSVRFVARRRPPDADIELTGSWDRAHARIRVPGAGFPSEPVLHPCTAAESVGFWPRLPRGGRHPYRVPAATGDGWATARAAEVGFDEGALARFTASLADTDPAAPRAPLVHACLIERHGRLVYEEYFFGFDRDRTHDLRSASKTFASVMVGAAMREGHAIAPESTIVALIHPHAPFANPDPRKARITLGELMTHTSGLACDDNDEASPGNEDTMQSQAVDDWWQYMLDLPVANDPGTHYAYCSGGMNLVGAALSAVTGLWIPAYFDSVVARPLGFGRYDYNLMPDGEGYLGGGIQLRPRDLLKLGRAYLDGGVWRGRRIVDSSWVRRSTSNQVRAKDGTDGFAWHLNTLKNGDREYREYEANGNGGQLLIVLPELDMSVVFTAGNYQAGGIWTRFRNELVPQRIIPALREP